MNKLDYETLYTEFIYIYIYKKYKCPLLEKMRGKIYYFPRTFEVFWDILKREKKNEE